MPVNLVIFFPQIVEDLQAWNMQVATDLVSFQGRVLNPEKIIQGAQGREEVYDAGPTGDWTQRLKSMVAMHMFVIYCHKCKVIFQITKCCRLLLLSIGSLWYPVR
jgi:hypothetical protein